MHQHALIQSLISSKLLASQDQKLYAMPQHSLKTIGWLNTLAHSKLFMITALNFKVTISSSLSITLASKLSTSLHMHQQQMQSLKLHTKSLDKQFAGS